MRKDVSLNLSEAGLLVNNQSFVFSHLFLNSLKRAYKKKNILISNIYFEINGTSTSLIFSLFFRSRFSSKIRRFFIKHSSSSRSRKENKNLNPLSLFSLLGNQFFIKNQVLNNQLETSQLNSLYKQFSFFERGLFNRRFNVFLDFIKILCLFKTGFLGVSVLAEILGEIFKHIQKKSHSRYIFFIKYLFGSLCEGPESRFRGMRLFISGKLLGKPRSSCVKVIKGSVPLKTFDSLVKHHSLSIQTGYGTFGLKVWVNYNTIKLI